MSILAVYDCMLFFGEATRPTRSRETFELLRQKIVTVCMSPEVLAEIQDVLGRPEHRRRFPALTDEAVAAFLREIVAASHAVADVPHVYTLVRDPKDSKYVNLAVAAGAPYLVTRDKDLLDLMQQSNPEGRDFCQRFPKLRILEPREFVQEVGRETPTV
jgi:putative PIN family toxin of toxin-antitoxin system